MTTVNRGARVCRQDTVPRTHSSWRIAFNSSLYSILRTRRRRLRIKRSTSNISTNDSTVDASCREGYAVLQSAQSVPTGHGFGTLHTPSFS